MYRIQTIANKLAGNVVIFILHFALISFGIVYKAYFFLEEFSCSLIKFRRTQLNYWNVQIVSFQQNNRDYTSKWHLVFPLNDIEWQRISRFNDIIKHSNDIRFSISSDSLNSFSTIQSQQQSNLIVAKLDMDQVFYALFHHKINSLSFNSVWNRKSSMCYFHHRQSEMKCFASFHHHSHKNFR